MREVPAWFLPGRPDGERVQRVRNRTLRCAGETDLLHPVSSGKVFERTSTKRRRRDRWLQGLPQRPLRQTNRAGHLQPMPTMSRGPLRRRDRYTTRRRLYNVRQGQVRNRARMPPFAERQRDVHGRRCSAYLSEFVHILLFWQVERRHRLARIVGLQKMSLGILSKSAWPVSGILVQIVPQGPLRIGNRASL